jgi:uncharacterized membrane protein
MAELVVIGYPDEATAQRAFDTVVGLDRQYVIQLAGAAVVKRELDGRLKVETPTGATAAGAAGGMLWGALIGLLFFAPLGGLVIGGLLGALTGKLDDLGIKDSFRARVQDAVKPGMAGLVLVYTKVTADKAIEELQPLGGDVLKTSLSREAEEELDQALAEGAR